jgi:hypothetical protein
MGQGDRRRVSACCPPLEVERLLSEPLAVAERSMRVSLALACVSLVLAACGPALPGRALTAAETEAEVTPTAEKCKVCSPQTYHVVRSDQLGRLRRAPSLTYVGTQQGFHFFRTWNKVLNPGEIQLVAVRLNQCSVANPQSIDAEEAIVGHRGVELLTGECVVR